jgi:hypothetical protein
VAAATTSTMAYRASSTELRSEVSTSGFWKTSRKLARVGPAGRAARVGVGSKGANTSHSMGRAKKAAARATNTEKPTRAATSRSEPPIRCAP